MSLEPSHGHNIYRHAPKWLPQQQKKLGKGLPLQREHHVVGACSGAANCTTHGSLLRQRHHADPPLFDATHQVNCLLTPLSLLPSHCYCRQPPGPPCPALQTLLAASQPHHHPPSYLRPNTARRRHTTLKLPPPPPARPPNY